jgi:hypothetical protein
MLLVFNLAAVWYLSETTIRSLHKFGLRGSVYDLAGMKGAFHSNHQKTSIAYENPQLLAVRVLFSQESQCGSFQSSLEGMVKRSFDKDAEIVHTRVYAPVNKLPNLVAVLSSDYITTDNPDSRDFSVFSRLSSPDDMIVDPDMQPLLWENANLSCFGGGCKGKKCHLMSQTSYIQHADNDNNILIMSAENHDRFDGYCPRTAIRWVGVTDRTVTVKDEEVTYCDIAIECSNADVYKCVGTSIKAGTVSEPDKMTYFTSVAVPSPTQFKQFLTFKYLETVGLQKSDESESAYVNLSRVRAEVKKSMEQDPAVTIDLNLQHKNKRNHAALEVVNDPMTR